VHGDVVVRRIEIADELQRGHHRELVATALIVEHAEIVEIDVGADADDVLRQFVVVVLRPVAGQDAGDVRAVIVRRIGVLTVDVRHAQQRFDELPVDRASFRERTFELRERFLEVIFFLLARFVQPRLDARGLRVVVGIEEVVE
jgi:hypothetical protein